MTHILSATSTQCLIDSGNAFQCMLDSIIAAFGGEAVAGFVIGGMLILSLYISASYHPAPPAIGTMLLGGLMLPFMPPQYQRMAQVVILMGFIAGIYVMLRRYTLEVGR